MRVRGRTILLAAAVTVALLPGGGTTPAAATTVTQVAGVTLSVGDASLVGAQLTTMRVSVHLVDPDGVAPSGGWDSLTQVALHCPCVKVESFKGSLRGYGLPQSLTYRIVELTRSSGTAHNGWWTGTAQLGGVSAGVWRPTAITAGDLVKVDDHSNPWSGDTSFVSLSPALVTATSVNVRSTDRPLLWVTIPTKAVPAGTLYPVSGQMRLMTSRRPAVGARLVIGTGQCQPWDYWRVAVHTTSSTGTWILHSRRIVSAWCAIYGLDARGINAIEWKTTSANFIRATITATPAAKSVPAGHSVKITGRANPLDHVYLQRYYAGGWHRVATATLYYATGAYRVYASPPRGTWRYRTQVMMTPGSGVLNAASHEFKLTGR
jgi:hypothetical protein